MINLGRYPGKGLMNYYIPRKTVDYILEISSGFLLFFAWGISLYPLILDSAYAQPYDIWLFLLVFTLIALLILTLNRISTKHYNFPVPVHEGNIIIQLFLAHRFLRVMTLCLSLTAFLYSLSQSLYLGGIGSPALSWIANRFLLLLFPLLIIYYFIARRYR